MNKKIILFCMLLLSVGLLSGCTSDKYVNSYYKDGIVTEVEYDIIFGGTFTDWRDELHFGDGTRLWIKDSDLSIVRLNESGMYHFKTNFFTYDGREYKFYKLIDVRYYDDLEI